MTQSPNPVLIIGGGMAGITAAVELAEAGRETILIEREAFLGGNVVRMNNYFPKLCPPVCGLEINFRRIRQNQRIRVITQSTVTSITGTKGDYTATIKTAPQRVNDLCTACGDCTRVCPVETPDPFNQGQTATKAVRLPHPMAFPPKYYIDPEACTGTSCAQCIDVCTYGAIDLNATETEHTVNVSSVILATGWHAYDATKLDLLGYAASPDVVTNMEFERMLALGPVTRPSDNQTPKQIVFVQCAGSRDENHLPYCSAVCCSASLKHALNVAEQLPDAQATICYIDLRVTGRNEDFLNRVEAHPRIHLHKGKAAKVTPDQASGKIMVTAESVMEGTKRTLEADLVVLATGIVPNTFPALEDQAGMYGFMHSASAEAMINAGSAEGIISAGCCHAPMDVSATVKEATAAAMKAIHKTTV